MRNIQKPGLIWLLIVTLINYLAQIPYYLRLYYFPHHLLPSVSAVLLLGGTLLWFLVGYIGTQLKNNWGYRALVGFLIIEALFYTLSVVRGGFWYQIHAADPLIKSIFIIGYISGGVAGYYAYYLARFRSAYLR